MIFLGKILSWITGDLSRSLANAYAAKQNATTEQERIKSEVDIAVLNTRQANRALGGRLTAIIQGSWAAPFILYRAKLLVWDKMLGLGVTDPLSPELLALELRIVTFYFGGAAAIGVVRALRR